MSEKPFSIRLTDDEKKTLERIAKSKGMSMADVVRTLITRGDIVNVLAEQLSDLSKDFTTWHLSNRGSSVTWLAEALLREAPLEEHAIIQRMFQNEGNRLRNKITEFNNNLKLFINSVDLKKKGALATFIKSFISIVDAYQNNFVNHFYQIAAIIPKENRNRVKAPYSDEFRVRYNEFAVRYEDFLRRASRELGENLERTLERVKEFPQIREPWRRPSEPGI